LNRREHLLSVFHGKSWAGGGQYARGRHHEFQREDCTPMKSPI
jgi:hypothetical protein